MASGRVFMEAAPAGLDPEQIGRVLAAQPGVVEVHDLHVWEVTSGFPALSAHVVVRAGDDCHERRRRRSSSCSRSGSGSTTRRSRSITRRRRSRRCRSRLPAIDCADEGGQARTRPRRAPWSASAAPRSRRPPPALRTSTWRSSGCRPARARARTTTRAARAPCSCCRAVCASSWGDHLEQEVTLEPRDLVYVPPRETHVLENVSDTEPAEYVVARDSPHEDAVVVPWARGGRREHRRESYLTGGRWPAHLLAVVAPREGPRARCRGRARRQRAQRPLRHVAVRFVDEGFAVYAIDHRGPRPLGGPSRADRPDGNAVADLDSLIGLAAASIPTRRCSCSGTAWARHLGHATRSATRTGSPV